MNILMIPSWYLSKDNRIKGSFFREQALMMNHNGNRVTILFVQLHASGEKIDNKIEEYDDEGMLTFIYHIHSYGFARDVRLLKRILTHYYSKIYKIMIERDFYPDLIQAHGFLPAGIIACMLGKRKHVPVVVTEHSSKVHTKGLNRLEINELRQVIRDCTSFCCVSESLRNSALEYCPGASIKILPNNLSRGFNYKEEKSSEAFYFVSIGNLIESKRHKLLVECFSEAFCNGENVRLLIAGEGVEKKKIEETIVQRKESDRVRLLGRIDRNEIVKLLNKSHVLVLLSTNETFGVVYIEGMACGCPVIATKNGGADDLVTSDNGMLVEVDNRAEIKNALIDVYKNYSRYNLHQISENCINKYGEAAVFSLTEKLYNSITGR